MTEQERREGFARELDELVAKWGCTVIDMVRTEQHGTQVQITPGVQIIVMENWQATADSQSAVISQKIRDSTQRHKDA